MLGLNSRPSVDINDTSKVFVTAAATPGVEIQTYQSLVNVTTASSGFVQLPDARDVEPGTVILVKIISGTNATTVYGPGDVVKQSAGNMDAVGDMCFCISHGTVWTLREDVI